MTRSRLIALLIVALGLAVAVTAATHHELEGSPRPNIVLVVLDTVRRDAVDLRPGPAAENGLTPCVRRLAETSTVFTNAWSNAPWTVPSHASLFTGLTPSDHRCQSHSPRLSPDVPTIAEILSDAGYETAAFYSNPWLGDDVSGVLRGFATRSEARSHEGHALDTSDQGGAEVVTDVGCWLEERDAERPFFLFVNILEAHLPYRLPDTLLAMEGIERGGDEGVSVEWAHEYNAGLRPPEWQNRARVRSFYSMDVAMADWLLLGIIRKLEKSGFGEDTVIIVTSDHGENLGDHGLMDHQFCIYETLLRIPLIVHLPGSARREVRDDPVMLTDLFATLVDVAGADGSAVPEGSVSLLGQPMDPDRPLAAEYGGASEGLLRLLESRNPRLRREPLMRAYSTIRVGNLRLTVSSDGFAELHDVELDPDQRNDLSLARASDVKRLSALIPARPSRGDGGGLALSLADRERLEALGYIH
jgi:arylsulfatase A-like enzyme